MWKPIQVAIVFTVLWTATASADVTLTGSQSLVVDSFHNADYMLHDTSRLDVTQAGYIDGGVFARDGAALNISDGGYVWTIGMYNASRLTINQGTVDSFTLLDDSVATLAGAVVDWVAVRNNSRLTASSSIIDTIDCDQAANVTLTGGTLGQMSLQRDCVAALYDVVVSEGVSIANRSYIEVHGGNIRNLNVILGGTAELFGGRFDEVNSDYSGPITFYGSDFLATDGLSFAGDQVIGTGTLSGKWLDGSTFSTAIIQNTGTIYAVPEPATMGLLALGGLAMLRRRNGYAG